MLPSFQINQQAATTHTKKKTLLSLHTWMSLACSCFFNGYSTDLRAIWYIWLVYSFSANLASLAQNSACISSSVSSFSLTCHFSSVSKHNKMSCCFC